MDIFVDAAKKHLLETDLEYHARYFFKKQKGYPFQITNFHAKLIKIFERVIKGELKKVVILVPPRHGKTEVAKLFCSMGFAHNPASEFIYTCSDSKLALDCSSEVREIIKSPDFARYWDIDIRVDTKAKGLWKTSQGGSFWAGGFGSPIIGYGAGKHPAAIKNTDCTFGGAILVDDPMKEQDRFRALEREKAIRFVEDTLPDRANDKNNTPIIVFMQPLHKEDLGQHIKKNKKEYEVFEFPIINEDNEPLVPELYSFDDVMKWKAEKSNEIWQAKFMLRPISIGGNILKTDLLKYYDELPFLKYRWIEVDTAQKIEEKHDYTVFQCWGKSYDGRIYLIDQFRGRVEYQALKDRFKAFWNKHNAVDNYDPRKYGYLSTCFIEDYNHGTAIIQEAKAEGNIPTTPVTRGKQSKFERAVNNAVPKLENGFIYLPENAIFLNDLIEEMESFTGQDDSKQAILQMDKKKTFDDQVDCLMSACEHGFTEMVSSSNVVSNFMERKFKRK